jgi:hypothetical protein
MSIILNSGKVDQMKSSNRALAIFGISLGLILVAAVILVLTVGKGNAPLLPPNSPEGTVQRYLTAVQDKDYSGAYSLIAPAPTPIDTFKAPPSGPPNSFDFWMMSVQNSANLSWKANLNKTTVAGDSASVEITVEVFRPGGPLSSPIHDITEVFNLTRSGNLWLIASPTDLYWIY